MDTYLSSRHAGVRGAGWAVNRIGDSKRRQETDTRQNEIGDRRSNEKIEKRREGVGGADCPGRIKNLRHHAQGGL